MTDLQRRTLSKLRAAAHAWPNMQAGMGFNACTIGGKRFADCARRMAKRGLVAWDGVSDNHSRYKITDAGERALLLG